VRDPGAFWERLHDYARLACPNIYHKKIDIPKNKRDPPKHKKKNQNTEVKKRAADSMATNKKNNKRQ